MRARFWGKSNGQNNSAFQHRDDWLCIGASCHDSAAVCSHGLFLRSRCFRPRSHEGRRSSERAAVRHSRRRKLQDGGVYKIPQVQFMVENGIVTRADSVAGSKVVTGDGLRLGSSLDQTTKRIPNLKVSDHKYIEGGHYLTELSRDGRRAVIFEEIDGKIDMIRTGLMPSVGYVERCL